MSRNILFPLCAAFILLPAVVQATHIVGGSINYRCLGNDNYEITLRVYRDCFLGAPNAPFDDPAHIGVFDGAGLLIEDVTIPFMADDTLDAVLNDPCLFVPPNVCVHTTTYRDTINLPFISGGYILAYQRCCRNQTIANIIDPLATGTTYPIRIREEAMLECNSSPTFNEWPPIFICVNKPLVFDHAATDPDGDSLVYKLCTPFAGGTLSTPQPIPPDPPPYDTVVWQQGFSLDDVLGGTGDPLTIDPVTGLMTAFPTIQGQFVVGVCVEEYDKETGELLSILRRDFQYNVGLCGEVASAFFAPEVQCDNLDVTFVNESTNAESFQWFFDFPNSTPGSDTTALEFTYTFPDTGLYTVMLIAEPNSICVDTFTQDIFLQYNSLEAGFEVFVFDCEDEAIIELTDMSVDSVSPPSAWLWTLTYGNVTLTSSLQNPVFNVPLGVSGTIALEVTSENGCISSLTKDFETGLDNPGELIVPNLEACLGDTIGLNPNTDPDISFSFLWSPADQLLDGPTIVNPRIIVTGDATFMVTITPSNPVCEIVKTVEVSVLPSPELSFNTETACDGLTIEFSNTSENASGFVWDFGDPNTESDTSTAVNPAYTYPDTGTYVVTLATAPGATCQGVILQEVPVNSIDLSADFSFFYGDCASDSIVVQFNDESFSNQGNITSWLWELSSGQTSTLQNPTFTFTENGIVLVSLTVTTANGCTNVMTKPVDILLLNDPPVYPDTLIICPGDSIQISPAGNVAFTYEWSPSAGLDDPASNSPVFFPDTTTTYTVTISAIGADTCQLQQEVLVIVPSDFDIEISGDTTTCEAATTLIAGSDLPGISFTWSNSSGNVLTDSDTLNIDVSGTAVYLLTGTDSFGCTKERMVSVSGGPVDVTLPDTVAICLGEALEVSVMNLDTNDLLTYTWTPTEDIISGAGTASPEISVEVGERTFYVEVENQFGCTFFDSVLVAVVDTAINLDFTYTLQCNGATVDFINTSTDAFGYVWDFGDGALSFEENPVHTYDTVGNYVVTLGIVYDVNCFDAPAVDTVEITDPDLIAGFDFELAECPGDSAKLNFFDASVNAFDNTIIWQWVFNQEDTLLVENPMYTVNESGPLIVQLNITTANKCTASVTDTLDIQLVDDIELPDTLIICAGDTVQLNSGGNPDYAYEWSPATGLDDPLAASPMASPLQTTTYTVSIQAFGSDTCAYVKEVTLVVPEAIDLDIGPAEILTCGEDVTLTVSANVQVSVEWLSFQEGPLPPGSSVTVNPFQTDTIVAMATDEFGCMDADTVIIIDNGVDVEIEPGTDITACAGLEASFSVTNLDPQDMLTYEWMPVENIISGADGPLVTVVVAAGAVTFTGIISNQFDCADTVQIMVTVQPLEVNLPDTVSVCPGVPTPLNPDADPSFTYEWSPAAGLDDPTSANPVFTGVMDMTYSVTVTGEVNGLVCETVEEVVVTASSDINLVIAPGDTSICTLGSLLLTASGELSGDIEWYDNPGLEVPIGTGPTITVDITEGNNTFFAILTGGTGCTDTASVTITGADFDPGLGSPVQVCAGQPTAVNPSGNPGYNYTWSPTTGLDLSQPWNPVATLDMDMTYSVTVTDPISGCELNTEVSVQVDPLINLSIAPADTSICTLGSLLLTASSELTDPGYEWYDDPALEEPIVTGPTISVEIVEGTNTFFAIATSEAGCTDTASVTITGTDFDAGLDSPVQVCAGQPTAINPSGNPNYNYSWEPATGLDLSQPWNPVATLDMDMTYSVTVTDPASGCELSQEVNVGIFPLIGLEAEGDTTICEDQSVVLSASSTQDGVTYTWFDNPDLQSPSVGNGPEIMVSPESLQVYYVVAEDENGCTALDSAEVNNAAISASLPPQIILCEPVDEIILSVVNLEPSQLLTYEWSPEENLMGDLAGPTVTAVVEVNDTLVVTVALTNQFGCTDELSALVGNFDLEPLISIQADPTNIEPGGSSTLTVSGCPDCDIFWTPAATLDTDTGPVVVATPEETTTYTVMVDLFGCITERSVTVTVDELICDEDHVFLPNAFSPNKDGENDILRLRSLFIDQLTDYELMIYNRWGEEVFRSQDKNEGWNGTFKGEELPPDVFAYYLRVICPGGEQLVQKGNVTLFR